MTTPNTFPLICLTLSENFPDSLNVWEGTLEEGSTADYADRRASSDSYRVRFHKKPVAKLNREMFVGYVSGDYASVEPFNVTNIHLSEAKENLASFFSDPPAETTDICGWLESMTTELRNEREQNEKLADKQKEEFFRLLAKQANLHGEKTS